MSFAAIWSGNIYNLRNSFGANCSFKLLRFQFGLTPGEVVGSSKCNLRFLATNAEGKNQKSQSKKPCSINVVKIVIELLVIELLGFYPIDPYPSLLLYICIVSPFIILSKPSLFHHHLLKNPSHHQNPYRHKKILILAINHLLHLFFLSSFSFHFFFFLDLM